MSEQQQGDLRKVERHILRKLSKLMLPPSQYDLWSRRLAEKGIRTSMADDWYIQDSLDAVYLEAWNFSVKDRKVTPEKAREYAKIVLERTKGKITDWLIKKTHVTVSPKAKLRTRLLDPYMEKAMESLDYPPKARI